jgi:diaminopimelate decarboxylase
MADIKALVERVNSLNLNIDSIEEIRIPGYMPEVIPNADGKKLSLAIYAAITSNDGYIDVESARRGLDIFGDDFIAESRTGIGHTNISRLEDIVNHKNKIRCDIIRRESAKPVPEHVKEAIHSIRKKYPAPFHVYDVEAIRQTARDFNKAFDWIVGGFKNFFAVKALPNPYIIELLKHEGFGADCSSLPELLLAEAAGIYGENKIMTSNDTPASEFKKAFDLGAIINLDDISHIDILEKTAGIPDIICFRYNPGKERTGNAIIGEPSEAKYGLTKEQLFEAYRIMKDKGVKRFGLHTMVASNELNSQYFIETGRMLFDLARDISKEIGIKFEFINLGGGIGTPYKPEQKPVDLEFVSAGIKELYKEKIEANGLHPVRVVMECGRAITGPHGYLASEVLHLKHTHKDFVGLDACMTNLMRPALYGAYHHITVLGKEEQPKNHIYDVTGSLCENNDKFAINRPLPEISRGDILVIHNTGAHGHAMGFNYNGKLRSAEFLADKDGDYEMIRRRELPNDLFATLSFPGARFDL